MPPQKKLRVAVERIDNKLAVLLDDAGRRYNVSAAILRRGCRAEGAVLDAPIDDDGKPRWGDAARNWDEERRRKPSDSDAEDDAPPARPKSRPFR